ncbi:hypothetical protein SCH01S_17_00130 [Sphingomonas changbaiensis NBRC 104936]|uniref:Uncharacterized protein n=1 Tax=Sphingomonas changbaiensis NBRC 104936 TaxID=1219043 RepID=A0A0E9MM95_9SPHN|nr:hypothetical protein [Sphingomonas changbaiensis]GAO38659.1 hypothetical protein SCH01S_17_00130 [Sphingomonas changbaiensis NBRC 104936]
MKPAFPILLLAALGALPGASATATTVAASDVAVDAPWTASISKSDPSKLHLNVIEDRHGTLGTSVPIAELSGLTPEEIRGTGRPVTFTLRREAGTITFTGRFANGTGQGTLRYQGDPAYWSRIAAMGVENDLTTNRRVNLLALPLLDVRSDYIAALRREGAMAPLSDYVGMRAVGVRPEMVHEVRPLIAGGLRPHDLMAFAALGVTPDYARSMRTIFSSLEAQDLTSMKALGVTADYIATMRAAGARIRTAGDAQSFRALGISTAAVKRAVEHGRPNPTASEVMQISMRY